ncbi:histone-lysine N-methyltransferase [Thecamonas trahens ATCC 50062]|uniref:[histone H3]-lysine(36) N-trimethyltransferase n=1 Tax=Thecamonas trahens ATCC 50062 TaxID=461836 RepID=A0A0L0DUN5_THETB|nr:histone-lysine N-methyltransferase [Thecamonas trahens ATCC 50062]KNC56044.1 histone-lysine N-methyltransferase [Thecamonas trahens ATCC 50062]|eukprot:XP_013761088.1 histone-lysine N-methyltransferase [Thecamonas trahens ATCC 50062]
MTDNVTQESGAALGHADGSRAGEGGAAGEVGLANTAGLEGADEAEDGTVAMEVVGGAGNGSTSGGSGKDEVRERNLAAVDTLVDADDEGAWHENWGQPVPGPYNFKELTENKFVSRKKKSRPAYDEAFQCECDNEVQCGPGCENFDMAIECIEGYCHMRDLCRNQRLQRKQTADVEVFQTKLKGLGLRACSKVSQGDLIMEYVGDIIDKREFNRRVKAYADENITHFYFMSIGNEEMIDATKAGNISRFINHSCAPNARTEMWTVANEHRVGLYAVNDIYPGEEITFDYQFERYGAQAQQCFCGEVACRGTIGGERKELGAFFSANAASASDDDDDDVEASGERKASSRKSSSKAEIKRIMDERQRRLIFDLSNSDYTLEQRLAVLCSKSGGLGSTKYVKDFKKLLLQVDSAHNKALLANVMAKTTASTVLRELAKGNTVSALVRWLAYTDGKDKWAEFQLAVLTALRKLPLSLDQMANKSLNSRLSKMVEYPTADVASAAQSLLDHFSNAQSSQVFIPRKKMQPPPLEAAAAPTDPNALLPAPMMVLPEPMAVGPASDAPVRKPAQARPPKRRTSAAGSAMFSSPPPEDKSASFRAPPPLNPRPRDGGRDSGRDYSRDSGRDYSRDSGRDYSRDYVRGGGREYSRDVQAAPASAAVRTGSAVSMSVEGMDPATKETSKLIQDTASEQAKRLLQQSEAEARRETKRRRAKEAEMRKAKKRKLLSKSGVTRDMKPSSKLVTLLRDETPLDPLQPLFKTRVSELIKEALRPFHKAGRFASKDDFAHLARKFSHQIREKEGDARRNNGASYSVVTAKLNRIL